MVPSALMESRAPRLIAKSFCQAGLDHPSAKLSAVGNASRHLAVYDPKTKQLTHISTCFSTHHLMFAEDANNTLWTSGGGAPGPPLAERGRSLSAELNASGPNAHTDSWQE